MLGGGCIKSDTIHNVTNMESIAKSEDRVMRSGKSHLIFLIGGVFFVLASLQVGRDVPQGAVAPISTLVGIGVFMIVIAALSFLNKKIAFHFEEFLQRPSKWFKIPSWGFSLISISPLFSILAHYAAGESALMHSPVVGWAAWILSILLILVGAWQQDRFDLTSRRNLLLIGAGLFALGYMFRGFTPEYYPVIFSGNEGSAGLVGMDILAGKFNNPFADGWFSFPGLYFFIPAGSMAIFGHTLSALRIPSIFAGSMTVGLAYLTSRAMYGRQTALLAALLLAGFQIHIHFSRIGLSNAWDGLFFVAVIGTAWYAWEYENRNAFLLSGFGLGLSQYFYVTSHILLVLIPAWLAIVSLLNHARFKRLFPAILLMTLTALVVVLPLAWFYVHYPSEFLAPLLRVNVFGSSLDSVIQNDGSVLITIMLEKFWLGAQSFTYLPIWSWWYPSGAPFLPSPVAEFFLVGFVFLLFKARESRNILLFLWLVAFVFVGGFSDHVPSPQRYVAVMPACMMVAAFGLTQLIEILEKLWPKMIPYAKTLVLIGVLYLSIKDVINYYTYFTQVTRYYMHASDGMIAQRLGRFLQTQPEDTQVVFFGYPRMGYYSIPSTQFLVPKIVGLDMQESWGSTVNPKPDSSHLVFVFLPQHSAEIPRVQADYPGGRLFEERSHWNQLLYYYYVYED